MNNSPFGKLNLRDLINGLVVAFLTASLTGVLGKMWRKQNLYALSVFNLCILNWMQ